LLLYLLGSIILFKVINMEELAKNSLYTVTITGYASDGSGVCRIGGRAVFIKGAMPGETWEVRIMKVTSSAVYARGEKLLSSSVFRIEPSCSHFGKCGGCDFQYMTYEEELRFKLGRLNDAISHIGGLDFSISNILGAEYTDRYRNKTIHAVGSKNGVISAGFFRPRSHDIVPIGSCLIQPEFTDRTVSALLHWMQMHNIEPYDEASKKGSVRHIFTRYAFSTGEAMVCIVSARGLGSATQSLAPALKKACPELTSIILNINRTSGNTVLSGEFHTIWGRDTIEDILCGLRFRLSPITFFQINPPQAEKLYNLAVDYACPGETETVLDLYCGAGTISLCLARRAKKVIGAEIVESAVNDAVKNAALNGITNAEFICADAEKAAAELLKRGIRPNAVVVDPPRKGLAENVIEHIVSMEPERIVYVSCDPATLARDLKILDQKGYNVKAGTAVDMFPRCAHVETVARLERVRII
jgi:23S rRNA (uracil1939-C5)-methyltransferase